MDETGTPDGKQWPPGHGLVVTRTETGAATVTFTEIPTRVTCVIAEGRNLIGSSTITPVALQQTITAAAPATQVLPPGSTFYNIRQPSQGSLALEF